MHFESPKAHESMFHDDCWKKRFVFIQFAAEENYLKKVASRQNTSRRRRRCGQSNRRQLKASICSTPKVKVFLFTVCVCVISPFFCCCCALMLRCFKRYFLLYVFTFICCRSVFHYGLFIVFGIIIIRPAWQRLTTFAPHTQCMYSFNRLVYLFLINDR